MIQQMGYLDVKGRDERTFKFIFDLNSPAGEILDALSTMKGEILLAIQRQDAEQNKKLKASEENKDAAEERQEPEGNQ